MTKRMKPLPMIEEIAAHRSVRSNYRYIGVHEGDDLLEIMLLLPDDPVRALPDRLRTARRHFVRSLSTAEPRVKSSRGEIPRFGFDLSRKEELLDSLDRLDAQLARIFEAPLPAKLVDSLLGISATERRRWSKDGRLPPCGSRMSTRGGSRFNLPIFAVDLVRALRQNPQIIAKWRRYEGISVRPAHHRKSMLPMQT